MEIGTMKELHKMGTKQMKVATYIVEFLKRKGIQTVFELQGGMITRMVDELYIAGGFEIVSVHHEQAAAFAADAFARVTGKPGVAMATSGPGATNLITGIGNCYFDSVPALFITGQVNINEQKGDRAIRQLGFQETDIVSIAQPITKCTFAVKSATEIPAILEEAYRISVSGRPGPVLIDIPMNIQREEITVSTPSESIPLPIDYKPIEVFCDALQHALAASSKPLVLVGRGVRAGGATNDFIQFIEQYHLPVVCSLLGLDIVPFNHPNRVGFIGTYGNRWANDALGNCDLLLVLGSRLDLRQTGADTESFQQNKKIFHVDIEEAELNNRFKQCVTLQANLLDFFHTAIKKPITPLSCKLWFDAIGEKKLQWLDTHELKQIQGINPNIFIHQLSQKSTSAKAFTTDVGNNQMWAAQSIELQPGQLFLSSGGMGAMGYSLPAAIGASFALNKAPVVALAGDGGFQINLQELQTIYRNQLPIKIVILNNRCLGMIRQFQDSYFDSRYQSTVWGYSAPDFVAVAKAYGIDGMTLETPDQINETLEKMWLYPNRPFLLNVLIDIHTNAFPKLAFGMPISIMEPIIN